MERTISYLCDGVCDEVGKYLISRGFSTGLIRGLKRSQGIILNGTPARVIDRIRAGDILEITMRESWEAAANWELKAAVVYDDEDIVVFDKPPDMAVHQSLGHENDTLANLYAALYPDTVFHAVSRLDRNTSGLILAAKNQYAASLLMGKNRNNIQKVYYAVAEGNVHEKYGDHGEITAPIAREADSIITRVVRSDGQYAHTKFSVISYSDSFSFLELSLLTGRTHQIRVHLSYIGYPLAGDDLYGGSREYICRHALHCGKMSFIHPVTGEMISLSAELPGDMRGLTEMIK